MTRLLLSCVVAGAVGAGTAAAHHTVPGRAHPTVTITQAVLADGKPLEPGTYEVYITEEKPDVGAGAPSDAQRVVEFARNGKVVAREIAEVIPAAGAREVVGTSGSDAQPAAGSQAKPVARVERLREGDFVRVSVTEGGARYLIHLPTGSDRAAKPSAPSPQ